MRKSLYLLLCLALLLSGCGVVMESLPEYASPISTPSSGTATPASSPSSSGQKDRTNYDYELIFPSDKYPETALHIHGAIEMGYSDVCTIDRGGAEQNRKKSLAGIETRQGYDRDEWPMAMCGEGGAGASVAYIDASDNRGAGSWVGNQLKEYPDGTRILFIVDKPTNLFPVHSPSASSQPSEDAEVYYKNCTAVREAGKAPLHKGEPGYAAHLDRDGNGVACE